MDRDLELRVGSDEELIAAGLDIHLSTAAGEAVENLGRFFEVVIGPPDLVAVSGDTHEDILLGDRQSCDPRACGHHLGDVGVTDLGCGDFGQSSLERGELPLVEAQAGLERLGDFFLFVGQFFDLAVDLFEGLFDASDVSLDELVHRVGLGFGFLLGLLLELFRVGEVGRVALQLDLPGPGQTSHLPVPGHKDVDVAGGVDRGRNEVEFDLGFEFAFGGVVLDIALARADTGPDVARLIQTIRIEVDLLPVVLGVDRAGLFVGGRDLGLVGDVALLLRVLQRVDRVLDLFGHRRRCRGFIGSVQCFH